MEEREDTKPPKIKVKGKIPYVAEINLDDVKRDSSTATLQLSPRGGGGGGGGHGGGGNATAKSGPRWNCLCSPTTHVGSFRCRHHRAGGGLGGMTRGGSVGSNLSMLGQSKSHSLSDSLKAQ